MPMPSVEDLQSMYGSWNPQAYLEAQSNAGLERQIRESEYGRQQQLEQQAGLDTLFRQQDDPNRIQERVLTNRNRELTNTGLGYKNDSDALDLERKRALQSLNLDADKRKALMQVTEDQLKEADLQVEQMRRSLDPAQQARGEKLYQLTGAARALQAQRDEAMKMEQYKQLQETGRAIERNNTTIKAAEIGATSRVDAAGKRGNSIPKPPNTPIAQYLADLRQAYADGKIEEDVYNRSVANAVNAELAAKTAGRTGGVELALPLGGGSPQLAPKAPAPTVAPVAGEITTTKPPVTKLTELQKMYPGKSEAELRAAYKKKFGVDLQ